MITKEDVKEIKKLLKKSDLNQHQIANLFGVNQSVISRIKYNKTHKLI